MRLGQVRVNGSGLPMLDGPDELIAREGGEAEKRRLERVENIQ